MAIVYFVRTELGNDWVDAEFLSVYDIFSLGQKYHKSLIKCITGDEFLELCAEHVVTEDDVVISMDYEDRYLIPWD